MGPGGLGTGGVLGFLVAHPLKKAPGLEVIGRKSAQMAVEMPYHLALRLCDVTETHAVAPKGVERPTQPASGVPERTEKTRSPPESGQTTTTTEEMSFFLPSCLLEVLGDVGTTSEESLPSVKTLGGDLPGIVDPEKADRGASCSRRKTTIGRGRDRRTGEDGRQGLVEFVPQASRAGLRHGSGSRVGTECRSMIRPWTS